MQTNIFPIHIDLDNDLKLSFQRMSVVQTYRFFYSLSRKIIEGANKSEKDFYSVISGIIQNISEDDIDNILSVHMPYIKVLEEGKENSLNMEYHLKEKPHLVFTLIYKIMEVYYKSFFIELLKSLGLSQVVKNIEEALKTMKSAE